MADAMRAQIDQAVPGLFADIEHIGSTAVPGLAAKPIIDLMAATASLDAVVAREDALGTLGFRRIETGMPDRLFYARDDEVGRRTHHLHVVPLAAWDTRNERLLRDHLRTHPRDRDRYAMLKQTARDKDGEDYTRAKTAVIQYLVDRARSERGLPSVPVWEE